MRIVTKMELSLMQQAIDREAQDRQKLETRLEQAQERVIASELRREEVVVANIGLEQRLKDAQEANKVLQVNLDWFRLRLSQVEQERARLMYLHTGVKIETPSIEERPADPDTRLPDMLAHFGGFEDVGDEEAARQGIDWDNEGKVRYEKKD